MSDIFGRIGGPRDDETRQETAEELRPDAAGGRWLRRHMAGAVVAVTTVHDGKFRAATLNACIVASVAPLQVLISLERESQMLQWLRASGFFGISVLSWQQQLLADRFAGMAPLAPTTFRGIDHLTPVTGAPVLTESIGWADCHVLQEIETGDHVCFVGEVLAVGQGSGEREDPLVYFLNRYRRLH